MSFEQTNSAADPSPRSPEDGNFEDANEAVDSNSILSTLLTPGPPASELVQPASRRNSNSSIGPSARAQTSGSNPQRSNPVVSSMPSSTNSTSRDRGDPATCAKDNGTGASNRVSNSSLAPHSDASKTLPKVPSTVPPLPSVSVSPTHPPASVISASDSSMAASSQASMPSQQVPPNPLMNPLMMMMGMGMANPFLQQMMSQQLSSGTSIGGQMNDPMAMMNSYNMNMMKMWGDFSGMKPTSAASASGPVASASNSTPEAQAVGTRPSDTNSNSMPLFHESWLVWRKGQSESFGNCGVCSGVFICNGLYYIKVYIKLY